MPGRYPAWPVAPNSRILLGQLGNKPDGYEVGMSRTVIPARFGQEPIEMAAFDAWQDAEGLADASEAVKAAWRAFKPVWRKARAVDLEPVVERERPDWDADLDRWQAAGKARAIEMGRAFGLLHRLRKPKPLSESKRAAWWRWRSRVLRHDPSLWGAIWCVLAGEGTGLVAARINRRAASLEAAICTALSWLSREMYAQQGAIFQHRVRGCEPGPLVPIPYDGATTQ